MTKEMHKPEAKSRRAFVGFAISFAGAMLFGCSDLPRPFRPEAKGIDLRSVSYTTTVGVRPVDGAGPQDPYALPDAMAEELSRHGVPVTSDPGVPSRLLLVPQATVQPGAMGRERVDIAWRIIDEERSGQTLLTQTLYFPDGSWRLAKEGVLREVSQEAAPDIATAIMGKPSDPDPFPAFPGARLVVLPIRPAPGDASESVARALDTELRLASIPLTEIPAEGDLLLRGRIITTPRVSGYQQVQITWSVLRANDESEVGTIRQSNKVVAGSLDGPWGATATLVARGAVFGVLDLLARPEAAEARG